MRYGVLADVHANRQALDAALALFEREGVDGYLCAGDLVGYGAEPDAVVARVAALPGLVAVLGNHDLMALGRLPSGRLPPLAAESHAWTVAHLGEAARAALDGLPELARADGVVLAHGAPGDPERYVRDAQEAAALLAGMDETAGSSSQGVRVLVVGHTHEALAVSDRRGELLRGRSGTVAIEPGERLLLNPGAVGQARERRALARVALLDLGRGEAAFHALRYDTAACRAALRRAGRPSWSCHLSPALPARARRRLARAVARPA